MVNFFVKTFTTCVAMFFDNGSEISFGSEGRISGARYRCLVPARARVCIRRNTLQMHTLKAAAAAATAVVAAAIVKGSRWSVAEFSLVVLVPATLPRHRASAHRVSSPTGSRRLATVYWLHTDSRPNSILRPQQRCVG